MNTFANTLDAAQWLRAQRAGGLQVCALVDGSAPSPRRQHWRGMQDINLFARLSADPQALAIAPRLLAPGESHDERFLAGYEQQSAEQCCVSLIATPLALPELATRLERRIHVDAAGLPMMLRFWDPRVLRVLSRALGTDTLSALLAFGAQALVPNRAGGHEIVHLTCPEDDPLAHRKPELVQQELDALQEATYPDTLLGALREQDEPLLETVPDAHRYTLALQQWRACEDHQFSAVQDQVLALGLAIEHGEDWWHQPRWSAFLQSAKGRSLVETLRQQAGSEQDA